MDILNDPIDKLSSEELVLKCICTVSDIKNAADILLPVLNHLLNNIKKKED